MESRPHLRVRILHHGSQRHSGHRRQSEQPQARIVRLDQEMIGIDEKDRIREGSYCVEVEQPIFFCEGNVNLTCRINVQALTYSRPSAVALCGVDLR